MKKKNNAFVFLSIISVFVTFACGLFGRLVSGDSSNKVPTRQWASEAHASSEYDNPKWSAQQATGIPDTPECGDQSTAWASEDKYGLEWLEVYYENPVEPTDINIYETHTPSQIVRVELIDLQGTYHEVYTAQPEITDCPYILSIPVKKAGYLAVGVRVTVDQSQLNLPWDEIDAVELVGYSDETVADSREEKVMVPEPKPEKPPENHPSDDGPIVELPIANPSQAPSFNMTYTGCDEGQEQGTDTEASVHDDRIDIRLRGTHGKYVLVTIPRNLNDDFSDSLVPFALEGRVPSAAGLYIQSAWWFGERGSVSTHYNPDGTLSGEVEFEGTRKRGCDFKVNAQFEYIVLR